MYCCGFALYRHWMFSFSHHLKAHAEFWMTYVHFTKRSCLVCLWCLMSVEDAGAGSNRLVLETQATYRMEMAVNLSYTAFLFEYENWLLSDSMRRHPNSEVQLAWWLFRYHGDSGGVVVTNVPVKWPFGFYLPLGFCSVHLCLFFDSLAAGGPFEKNNLPVLFGDEQADRCLLSGKTFPHRGTEEKGWKKFLSTRGIDKYIDEV